MAYAHEKNKRLLDIFCRAVKGEALSISKIALEYNVSTRTIKRDINEIMCFLADSDDRGMELVYNRYDKCYYLNFNKFLNAKELISIIKVLIGSRAFSSEELLEIVSKLKKLTTHDDAKLLQEIIENEVKSYTPVKHDCHNLLDTLWELIMAIDNKTELTITYYKQNRELVRRRVKPVAIVFSEYYFYLLDYNTDKNSKTKIYRADRITHIIKHRTTFEIDKYNPFDEGILKQQIHYMYPGPYRKIKFEFSGPSLQAVLDKLPVSKVLKREGYKSIVEAFVYGEGIKMFLLSQGRHVKVLEPLDFVEEMKKEIYDMMSCYNEKSV